MVISGVLLQTASTVEQRSVWVWVHGVSSGVWAVGYLAHQLRPGRRRVEPPSYRDDPLRAQSIAAANGETRSA